MNPYWQGKTAIVTGAASGIGLALSKALLKQGAKVWMTDADSARLAQSAASLQPEFGAGLQWQALDVRDSTAVRALVGQVAAAGPGLDFMFNNAGIGIAGEVRHMGVAHFDRIIDINLRGVVNGTLAAYPLMVARGSGHIVNTASLSGLVATGLLTPYSMTKFAVVGLTKALAQEARAHGVAVSAICPAAVETPLLDAPNPGDLTPIGKRPDVRHYLTELAGAPYPVDRLAGDALRALENKTVQIVLPARGAVIAWLHRLAPSLVHWLGTQAVAKALKPPAA